MESQDVFSIISATLGVVAIVVAVWQGILSRNQLTLARETQNSTETALGDIRRLTEENRKIAEELKAEFDRRIGRIVDQALEAADRRAETEARSDMQGEEFAAKLFGWVGETFGEPLKRAVLEGGAEEQAEL